MKVQELFELPTGGSGCGSMRITANSVCLCVEYDFYREPEEWVGALVFDDLMAYRFGRENFSPDWVDDSYDALVEIVGSAWLEALTRAPTLYPQDLIGMRHFAVYLSNNGYLEVIAGSWREPEAQLGVLPDMLTADRR